MNSIMIIILLPFIGALIGYTTNYLAVRMLFRPHKTINILWLKLQGLLPKRRHDLAVSIGETVAQELVSVDDVTTIIKAVDFEKEITEITGEVVDKKIRNEMEKDIPMIALLPGDVFDKLKDVINKGILGNLDSVIGKLVGELEKRLDFKSSITEKIENFDLDTLEKMILRIASKELRHIEMLGGFIGFIIGLVQAGLLITLG